MMLQVPAFPIAPITSDGSAQIQNAATMQQVPTSGIPAATIEFVKPTPRTQDTGAQDRNLDLSPREKAVIEQFSSSSQNQNSQNHSDSSNMPPLLSPPDNMSEVTVGGPPTYRFHRTPDGNLYALSGRQAEELAPVPGNAYATMHKMRLVGAKAASNPVATSFMLAQLASFQGRTASVVAQRNQQRAVVEHAKQSNAVMARVAKHAESQGQKMSAASSAHIKQAQKAFASAEAQQHDIQRAEFKVKLKKANPAPKTVSADKVALKSKIRSGRTVASTSRKVAAFVQFAKPTGLAPNVVQMPKAA